MSPEHHEFSQSKHQKTTTEKVELAERRNEKLPPLQVDVCNIRSATYARIDKKDKFDISSTCFQFVMLKKKTLNDSKYG